MVIFSISKRNIEGMKICQVHIGKSNGLYDRFNVHGIGSKAGHTYLKTAFPSGEFQIPIPKGMVKRARACCRYSDTCNKR